MSEYTALHIKRYMVAVLPLSEIDREIVQIVLEKHGDNQTRAAQSLGISRTTLWRMLKD